MATTTDGNEMEDDQFALPPSSPHQTPAAATGSNAIPISNNTTQPNSAPPNTWQTQTNRGIISIFYFILILLLLLFFIFGYFCAEKMCNK